MEYWNKIVEWFVSTHINEQIMDVDYVGLFTNPWFMVPFCALLGYMVFRKQWRDLIIILVCVLFWWISGTEYMAGLLVNGEIQIERILPVVF